MVQRTAYRQNKSCKTVLFALVCVLIHYTPSYSQSHIDSVLQKLDPQKLAASIEASADRVQEKIVRKSAKVLDKMQRQEERIYRKLLNGKDSAMAKAKLNEAKEKYAALKRGLTAPAIATNIKQYIPRLDSLSTSLKFLEENGVGGKVKDALAKTTVLKDKLAQAEEIKKFIQQRREELKQHVEKLGMVKQLKQINKQVYYYAAQLKEYKDILNDPKKIEKKALELLSKTKIWKEFFRKNSMLASLFRIPTDANDPSGQTSLAGLQTRAQVTNLIQQQIQSAGPNGMQQFQQNLEQAQSQLNQLKDKILKTGSNSTDDELPDFKPNTQKTKSFLKRLEFGANVQNQKATNFFPVTSDLGLSVGYKFNDKSIIGIGASYKLGWGRGWNHIRLSNEGVGLRSYVDWKIKGSFWISGGYEQNYRAVFSDFVQLRDKNAWQQSGLIGFSKTVPVKSKFFKKTSLKLLWDFLSYQQVPRTQPIIFRVGYNLN